MARLSRTLFCLGWLPAAATAMTLSGCTQNATEPSETTSTDHGEHAESDHDEHGEHGHGAHGPNGGDLVELGQDEYHAEVVHGAGKVTVFVLDSTAKEPVAIDAAEVTINLTHDGKPEQFKLAAAPQEADGEGKSSRFTIDDADLASHLDDAAGQARLMLTIGGKSYNGAIEHHHDHDHGHGHDHAD